MLDKTRKINSANTILKNGDGRLYFIQFEDIIFLESKSPYVTIYLINKRSIKLRVRLNVMVEKLTCIELIQLNRSIHVNPKYITEVNNVRNEVVLDNINKIKISRKYKDHFIKLLLEGKNLIQL